ncbi:hypothetical protein WQE_47694 [Paraburkholderia hospita]|uniref:Inclusion body protein n=1 Tax=Paraburkholderia hospita TaxID=169430 RepID=A0ABN0F5J4_9BURK|nr:hypothetical protein [Paraburkholderia hospita]EIM93892.1 hypothetical protein WQE_47694 [Paraburkholderia hospita]OUL92583.1 hypothetical protein CA602_02885 [Paraburkholderia hospita]
MSIDENLAVSRHLSVIYADDLRQEIDGKITIIGMYQSQMLVESFPVTLPKLAVFITAVTPVAQPFGKVSLQILKDDYVLQGLDLDLANEEAVGPSTIQEGVGTREFNIATIISPLQLDGPCNLRVRWHTELGIISGRPLMIKAASNGSAQ